MESRSENFSAVLLRWPLWFQLLAAALCGISDYAMSIFLAPHIPLYLDMIFTMLASYFGWFAGIGAALIHHLLSINAPDGLVSFPFIICSLTGVGIIRFFLQKNKSIKPFDLVFIIFVMCIVIAVEGGIIYTVLFTNFNYTEHMITKYFTLSLIVQHIPMIISAIIARIPTNLIDKAIAVIISWLLIIGIEKIRSLI